MAAGRAVAARDPRACDRHDPARRVRRAGAGAGPGRDRPAGRGARCCGPGSRTWPGRPARADRRGAGPVAAGAGAGRRLPGPVRRCPAGTTWSCCAAGPPICTPRGQVSGRHDTIATLWDISLERISSENPAAVAAAGRVRLPGPRADPAGPVHRPCRTCCPSRCRQLPPTELAFNEAIAVLVDYSLAKRTAAGLQLHRLVQAAIRARHAQHARQLARPGDS